MCDHDVCFNIKFKMEEMNGKWWAMRVDWECETVQYIVSYSESHKDRGNSTHRILSHDVHSAGSRIKHRPIDLTMVSNFYPQVHLLNTAHKLSINSSLYFIFFLGGYHVLMLTIILKKTKLILKIWKLNWLWNKIKWTHKQNSN